MLEVDARRKLADPSIVGLDKVASRVGYRIRTGGRSCIGRTKPTWTAPLWRVENVEELAADLKIDPFVYGELFEERHIHQWVKLLTNIQNAAVGLRGIGQA